MMERSHSSGFCISDFRHSHPSSSSRTGTRLHPRRSPTLPLVSRLSASLLSSGASKARSSDVAVKDFRAANCERMEECGRFNSEGGRLMRLALIAALTAGVLSGCGTFVPVIDVKKVPEDELQAAYKIRTYTPENASNYPVVSEYIGPITAYSCKHWMTDPPASKGDALLQLRLKALEKKADAVIDVTFDARGTDTWGTNCWETVQASGVAVKIKATQ